MPSDSQDAPSERLPDGPPAAAQAAEAVAVREAHERVLARKPDYETAEDPIVRVRATELRQRFLEPVDARDAGAAPR